jgi:four helix bundle protein
MADQHIPIEDTSLYKIFEKVADDVWEMVDKWPPFAKSAMGRQLVTAADSVTANLAEGDGRYGSFDAINFFIIARGSAREIRERLRRAVKRGLASPTMVDAVEQGLRELNALISYRRRVARPTGVREELRHYGTPEEHPLNT